MLILVYTTARKNRNLNHLQMHGIEKPCKIPLPNATRWNSWFKMVFYAKDHICYWTSFYHEEYEKDKNNESVSAINGILQNEQKRGMIIIYINFILHFAQEFVQDLDFFNNKINQYFHLLKDALNNLHHI